MPVKPIEGVGLAKSLSGMSAMPSSPNSMADLVQQMLRRGLVLDLSVAFGKPDVQIQSIDPFDALFALLAMGWGARRRSFADAIPSRTGNDFRISLLVRYVDTKARAVSSTLDDQSAEEFIYRLPRACDTETRYVLREA